MLDLLTPLPLRAGQRFSQLTMDLRELIVHHNVFHISLFASPVQDVFRVLALCPHTDL